MPYMPSSNAGLMCHQPNFLLHRNCWLFLIAALLYGALYGYADQIRRRRRVGQAPRRRLEETPPATNGLRALSAVGNHDGFIGEPESLGLRKANDAKSMPADCNDNVTITPLVVHDQEERVNHC